MSFSQAWHLLAVPATQLNLLERTNRDVVLVHTSFGVPSAFFRRLDSAIHGLPRGAARIFGPTCSFWILLVLSWRPARHAKLVKPQLPAITDRGIYSRIIVAQALYGFAAGLCIFSSTWAIALKVLLQINYVPAPRIGQVRLAVATRFC